jgi:hypothetical protein
MTAQIPSKVLETEITGPGTPPSALADILAGGPTLLVFLRHFG